MTLPSFSNSLSRQHMHTPKRNVQLGQQEKSQQEVTRKLDDYKQPLPEQYHKPKRLAFIPILSVTFTISHS